MNKNYYVGFCNHDTEKHVLMETMNPFDKITQDTPNVVECMCLNLLYDHFNELEQSALFRTICLLLGNSQVRKSYENENLFIVHIWDGKTKIGVTVEMLNTDSDNVESNFIECVNEYHNKMNNPNFLDTFQEIQ